MTEELPSHGLWSHLTWLRQKSPTHHLSRWVKVALIDTMIQSQLLPAGNWYTRSLGAYEGPTVINELKAVLLWGLCPCLGIHVSVPACGREQQGLMPGGSCHPFPGSCACHGLRAPME